jgi:two-component system, NarL family, response regulator LiaR
VDGIPKRVKAMGSQPIRVLIVDDHNMVREGLKILLNEFEDIQVVGDAANGLKALELFEALDPDVILMDLTMPVMDGIEATKRIIALRPDQHILILTGILNDERLFQAVQAGAQGCVEKTTEPVELIQSIRDVCSGTPSLSSGIAWRILRGLSGAEMPGQPKDRLSERETQILRLMTQGKLDQEIAEELVLTEVTIRTHISRIISKLGLENRVQAALYGLRSGLVSISETSDLFDARWR